MALLIDEAQDLPLETLRQLPLLVPLTSSQEPLLQIGLVGQPALAAPQAPAAPPRDAAHRPPCHDPAPDRGREPRVYPPARGQGRPAGGPIFTQEALQTIVRHAHGVPHDLNLLCTNALLAGCGAHQQPITADLVQQVRAVTRGRTAVPPGAAGPGHRGRPRARGGPPVGRRPSALGRGRHATAAAPAALQGEAPRPTSAPGSGCRPCHSLSLRHRRRLPSTAVGHAPGEDPVHHGPPAALERPGLETPSATLTPLAPAVPPPAPTLPPHAPLHPPAVSPRGESPQSVPRAEGRDSGEARRETRHGLSVDDPRERRRARTPDRGELRGRHQKDCPPALAGRAVTWPEGVHRWGSRGRLASQTQPNG